VISYQFLRCTVLIGTVIGLVIGRGWLAFFLSQLTGSLGWDVELIYQTFFVPVARTASLIAGIVGLSPDDGWMMIVVTIVPGILLCLCGTWFGSTLKSLVLSILIKNG
jgi:hypothetical protein